jgi:hypothetical protein
MAYHLWICYDLLINVNTGLITPPIGLGRPCDAPLNNKHLLNHKTLDMAYVN